MDILQRLYHPNIIRFREYLEDKSRCYIVTEYFEGQCLHELVYQKEKVGGRGKKKLVPMKEEPTRKIFSQVLNAIDYCHS